MEKTLLKIICENDVALLSLVKEKVAEGIDINRITEYGESALRYASNNGRFDVIAFLLENGAEEYQLEWTKLFHAIAFGTLEEMEEIITSGTDLEAQDYWSRTPFLFSILVGDIQKTEMLMQAGANISAVGRCGKPALHCAVQKDNAPMLMWLLAKGFDAEQVDDFGDTTLIAAVKYRAIACVKVLLESGADIFATNSIPEQAVTVAEQIDIVQLLVSAGADLNKMNKETRAKMLGYRVDEAPNVTSHEYNLYKRRVFGTRNPEPSRNPFWLEMVKCGASGYKAAKKFGDDSRFQYIASENATKEYYLSISAKGDERYAVMKNNNICCTVPVWSYDRFGKSITALGDGRFVEIAGEHEDSYDPDFCIYNDVFVHDGKGNCEIYTYPREVFPPTDFHTATLVDNDIYIIGNLGYPEDRKPNVTPVFQLDIKTLKIEPIETQGDIPGWISHHESRLDGKSLITITGGKRIVLSNGSESYKDNVDTYVLNLKTRKWTKVDSIK